VTAHRPPLGPFMRRHMGHPAVGFDESMLGDPEVEYEAAGLMGMGFAPGAAARMAVQKVRQRRHAAFQARCARMNQGNPMGRQFQFQAPP